MSKMRIVMFGLAIGSAIMAGLLAKKVIGKKPEVAKEVVTKVLTTDVLIAAKDLTTGERLAAGALVWKAWPNDNIQEAMITKEEKPDAEQVLSCRFSKVKPSTKRKLFFPALQVSWPPFCQKA
jgi:Flp pilus assembly protein CpaB